jgi:hypothetical protein
MRLVMTLFVLAFAFTLPASAGVPDPAQSSYSACLVTCPQGDIPFHVVVRDVAAVPVVGALVTLSTCVAAEVRYCPLNGTENYTLPGGCVVTGVTDASGALTIGIKSGGIGLGPIQLHADGVLLNSYAGVASTDLNGDSVVDVNDFNILSANVGSFDPRYDLDCAPPSNNQDQDFLQRHAGHMCEGVVPAQRRTLGGIKSIYR